jgi:hypothetical protein
MTLHTCPVHRSTPEISPLPTREQERRLKRNITSCLRRIGKIQQVQEGEVVSLVIGVIHQKGKETVEDE